MKEIKTQSSGLLHWKNADPMKWNNDPWEIAKFFMNPQGDKATAAAVTGPEKTDLSGMLNALINCKEFELNHIKDIKLAEKVRSVRNTLMHCATMSFEEDEMKDMIDKIIAFLEDDKELKVICKDTVKNIKSLKDKEFELKETHEHACIETALESHVLDVETAESEEEIDKVMIMTSKLSQLINGNKDLEKKFEDKFDKLMNVMQGYEARFSAVDLNVCALRKKMEYFEKQLQRERKQSFPDNPTTTLLGHEMSFCKGALQSYAHKKKLDLPKYDFKQTKNGMFVSTALFNGREFKSSEPRPAKKEAEQSAAEEALKFLGKEDLEECDEKSESPSTSAFLNERQGIDFEYSTHLVLPLFALITVYAQ